MKITHETPMGPLHLTLEHGHLVRLDFEDDATVSPSSSREDQRVSSEVRRQLDAYFGGRARTFSLPLAPRGTPFQQAVWRALRDLPFGTTATYGQLAARLGRPTASRAIGAANGRNPIAIVIPCHRVIGASGALTGYAGGLARKAALLAHEARWVARFEPAQNSCSHA